MQISWIKCKSQGDGVAYLFTSSTSQSLVLVFPSFFEMDISDTGPMNSQDESNLSNFSCPGFQRAHFLPYFVKYSLAFCYKVFFFKAIIAFKVAQLTDREDSDRIYLLSLKYPQYATFSNRHGFCSRHSSEATVSQTFFPHLLFKYQRQDRDLFRKTVSVRDHSTLQLLSFSYIKLTDLTIFKL